MQCMHTIQKTYLVEQQIKLLQHYNLFGLRFRNQNLSNNLLPSWSKIQVFFNFDVFILLATRLLKNNAFQTISLLQKAVRKGHTFSFFLLRSKYVFYFTAHKCLKKISSVYPFLYHRKCVAPTYACHFFHTSIICLYFSYIFIINTFFYQTGLVASEK